jgi:hypothetical protein
MKAALIYALLLSLVSPLIKASDSPTASERPLALIIFDGEHPELEARYGIDISFREWPFGTNSYECVITVAKSYSDKMKHPLLSVSDISGMTSAEAYSLSATLGWESNQDKSRICIYFKNQGNFQHTIILPFIAPDEVAAGLEIDVSKILLKRTRQSAPPKDKSNK